MSDKKIGAYDAEEEVLNLNPLEVLNPKQLQVYRSDATEILYGGSAGSGKSFLMRYLALISCISIPGLQCYIFRRNSIDLEKNYMVGSGCLPELVMPLVKLGECRINFKDSIIKFKNGSNIHLMHLQHEKDKYRMQGAEMNLLLIDELTHFTRSQYTYLRTRCRLGSLDIPDVYKHLFPRIVTASNPGGIGHSWVKSMFVTSAPSNEPWQVPKTDGGMVRAFYPALLTDNHHMMKIDPDYADRLRGETDAQMADALLNGNWDIVSGGALDDVWDRNTHVIPAFNVPENWFVNRSFDFGSSRPSGVIWWALSNGEQVKLANGEYKAFPKGTLFGIRELYTCKPGRENEGTRELAPEIAKRIKAIDEEIQIPRPVNLHPNLPWQGRKVRPGPADSSIWTEERGDSIANDMKKEGVKWNKANKKKGSRKSGLELLRVRLRNSVKYPDEKPGIYFFQELVHTARTLPELVRDPYDRDDVDTNCEDHLYDCVRYRLLDERQYRTVVQEV
nr:hypothetical protein 5 [Desulfobulbaceae bacterium]